KKSAKISSIRPIRVPILNKKSENCKQEDKKLIYGCSVSLGLAVSPIRPRVRLFSSGFLSYDY
ncbi:MAG: hypothetical protein AAF599_09395, partial [Bacteroidota bacterium]